MIAFSLKHAMRFQYPTGYKKNWEDRGLGGAHAMADHGAKIRQAQYNFVKEALDGAGKSVLPQDDTAMQAFATELRKSLAQTPQTMPLDSNEDIAQILSEVL